MKHNFNQNLQLKNAIYNITQFLTLKHEKPNINYIAYGPYLCGLHLPTY